MALSKEIPPVYHELQKKFGVKWGEVIIAYYPNIYCAIDIPEQKRVHEEVHLERQKKMGVSNWWAMYLEKPSFRLEEEVLAYRREKEWIRENVPNRNYRRLFLNIIYKDLSSYIYGNICTYDEAKRLLDV